MDDGRFFQLVLLVSKGAKKRGTTRMYLNMTKEFGVTSDTTPKRVQIFSFIGAAKLLLELDERREKREKRPSAPVTNQKNAPPPIVSKDLQRLIQKTDEPDGSDEVPVLEEYSDDNEDTAPLKSHKSDVCSSGKCKSGCGQTEAATKARWSNWQKPSQLDRARRHSRISPTDYRPPSKRRKTDAQRQVEIAVARMRKTSEEYKQSSKNLFRHIINGTTFKLLEDQADDASLQDFTPGQVNRVTRQTFAVAEIYEQMSELVMKSAACLEGHKSISSFFRGKSGLQYEKECDDIYQRISHKYGATKNEFTTKTHRAYVWESQYRHTGHFRRDRRGTAQV